MFPLSSSLVSPRVLLQLALLHGADQLRLIHDRHRQMVCPITCQYFYWKCSFLYSYHWKQNTLCIKPSGRIGYIMYLKQAKIKTQIFTRTKPLIIGCLLLFKWNNNSFVSWLDQLVFLFVEINWKQQIQLRFSWFNKKSSQVGLSL